MNKITNVNVNGTTYDVDIAIEGGLLSEKYAQDQEVIAAALNDLHTNVDTIDTSTTAMTTTMSEHEKAISAALVDVDTRISILDDNALETKESIQELNDAELFRGIHTKEQAVVGDIVLKCDNNSTIFVTPETYTAIYEDTDWEPTGIVVVPFDGTTVRAMSTRYMSCSDPENGSTTPSSMYWGADASSTALPTLSDHSLTTFNSNTFTIVYDICLPTDKMPSNRLAANAVRNNKDIGTYWDKNASGNQYYYKQESPYLTGNILDSNYGSNTSNPVSDKDGKSNTTAILTAVTADYSGSTITNSSSTGNYPAACCCNRYHTTYTSSGDWYLPSAYELSFIAPRCKKIFNAWKTINGGSLSLAYVPSSTIGSYAGGTRYVCSLQITGDSPYAEIYTINSAISNFSYTIAFIQI